MFNEKITQVYSEIHTKVEYTNGTNVSFDGSQIQAEFFAAWRLIDLYFKKNPVTELKFLEVGAWKGLWGIAFCEYCKLHNIRGTYLTVTMMDQDPNNQPLYKTINYLNSQGIEANLINMNTLDPDTLPAVLKYEASYDIVFIDADHSYEAVLSDINKFASLADKILLFHDIRPKQVMFNNGVYQAIVDSKLVLDDEIVTNDQLMGIGIKYTSNK
jgi:predicted O-methyltransferase YrrM